MLIPKLVVSLVDPKTGQPKPTELGALPEPVTAAEAGLMVGVPVPEGRRVNQANWIAWPNIRWSFMHTEEIRPSARIVAAGPIGDLLSDGTPSEVVGLEDLVIRDGDNGVWDLNEFLHRTYTDGFLVVHRGQVVCERYFNGMDRSTRHIMFSMTKTVTGLLALLAIDVGQMNLDDLLTAYLPELADTAYASVTVRQALDMTDGIRFGEDYADGGSDINRYAVALAFLPEPACWDGPKGIHEAILGFKDRDHLPGETFVYKSVTTDVLAWATARATGQRWVDGVSSLIWEPMGADQDASVMLDNQGVAVSSGGMSCTLRDLGRFVRMLGRSGRVGEESNERQAIPAKVADDIAAGGELLSGDLGGYPTRKDWTFHRHCWNLQHVLGGFMPMGVAGQRAFVHPEKDLVVVKFGSHPVTGNAYTDVVHESLYRAILERC